jgi:hypothetical protein
MRGIAKDCLAKRSLREKGVLPTTPFPQHYSVGVMWWEHDNYQAIRSGSLNEKSLLAKPISPAKAPSNQPSSTSGLVRRVRNTRRKLG